MRSRQLGLSARLCDSVQEAVRGAGIVITTTPSTVPLVEAAWLDPGTHVTAVGSDEPSKHELAPEVLARASVVAVDDRRQAASFGELHHAIDAGVRTEDDAVTLGELLEGVAQGRVGDEDITVADLTGVGVQDAAIAALVLREATAYRSDRLDATRARVSEGAHIRYRRTPIEIESPEQLGYSTIKNNLAESSFSDMCLADYGVDADLGRLLLPYGDHLGAERLRG